MSEHPIGEWYAHDATTAHNRPIWHSEVRVNVGPAAYQTIALCRRLFDQRKDAALIAAAPALIVALERLVECLSDSPDDSPPYFPTLCEDCRAFGRAALALARGEAPNA